MASRHPNLHWMGGRQYSELPRNVKAFDVCLMPFALNKATEFINPTKTLEYMASAKPIVSTGIDDVILQFSDIVQIASSHKEFIRMCIKSAAHPDSAAISRGRMRACQHSWDAIVQQLRNHIANILKTKTCFHKTFNHEAHYI